MAGSLQDQLLQAGLTDSKKAKQLDKEKRRAKRSARKSKEAPLDEARLAAQQTRADKAARDRELNRQRDAQAQDRAIAAQIAQLIDRHKISRSGGELGFNFTLGRSIKKIYVTAVQQRQLSIGKVAIAQRNDQFELVPAPVAEKIAERDPERVIFCTESQTEDLTAQEQEWYKDYEIPDDLMW